MKTLLTILLACFISISLFAQRPQFDYMLYDKTYAFVKEKYRDAGFKPVSMGMYSGQFSATFMSPVPQFYAICYKFEENKCTVIDLYLKSNGKRKIRRILDSDPNLTRAGKDVWTSASEKIFLKELLGPDGKSYYLECVKLK